MNEAANQTNIVENTADEDKHLRSLKIHTVARELNRQIEDANNNGHPVYLELHVRDGHLHVEPIFFRHPKLSTNETNPTPDKEKQISVFIEALQDSTELQDAVAAAVAKNFTRQPCTGSKMVKMYKNHTSSSITEA